MWPNLAAKTRGSHEWGRRQIELIIFFIERRRQVIVVKVRGIYMLEVKLISSSK